MGEYASFNGEQIKIGTCESMYYLRFQDRRKVTPLPHSLDPSDPQVVPRLRFRFPWPDEDRIPPGGAVYHVKGFERSLSVPGYEAPKKAEHRNVQFSAPAGYLASLPCPENRNVWNRDNGSTYRLNVHNGVETVHRNGFQGAVLLSAQKYVDGIGLVPILACGGCGALWREEDPFEIQKISVAFRSEGDRRERAGAHNGTGQVDRVFWDAIADRLLSGIYATLTGEG